MSMFSEEEKEQIKKSYLQRYEAIVRPKNLTPEQEERLINYLIRTAKERVMTCGEGHKHTDAMARQDESSPWICLSCGKEFADIEFVRKLTKEMENSNE